MGEGCRPSPVIPGACSREVSSCACTACRWTPVGFLAGCSPHAEQNRQQPIDEFEVTGYVHPVVPAGGSPLTGVVHPAGPHGPVVVGGPVGPCETTSLSSEEIQEPLEHTVLI